MTLNRPSRLLPLLMLVLTGAYLAVEFPFGALLLDVASSNPDADTLDRLEKTGRLIAGLAAALAVLPLVLRRCAAKNLGPLAILIRATATSAAIAAAVFVAQRALVDRIAETSSAETRRAAVQAIAIRNAVSAAGQIRGLPQTETQTPDRRAFAVLAPLTALVRPAALDDAGGLKALLTAQVRTEKSAEIADVRQAYATATSNFSAATDRIGADARKASETAWNDWHNWIVKRTYGLAVKWGINDADAASYRRIARQKGIPVRDDWYPLEETGFRKAFETSFVKQARERLGKADPAKAFPDGPPSETSVRDRLVADATSPAALFGDGYTHAEAGRSAVRAIAVPALALAFSLAGLLVHIFKFANFTALAAVPLSRRHPVLRIAAIAGLIVLSAAILRDGTNPITRSAYWQASSSAMSASLGATASAAATLVVEMQPSVYPLAAASADAPHFEPLAAWVRGTPHSRSPRERAVLASLGRTE